MVWNSITATGFLNLFYVAMALVAIYAMFSRYQFLKASRLCLDVGLMTGGLSIWALFSIVDILLILDWVPGLSGASRTSVREFLHLEVVWYSDLVASALLAVGFLRMIYRLSTRLSVLQEQADDAQEQKQVQATAHLEMREQAQLHQAQNRAKTEFLFSLNHELRTPLNGILGLTGLLSNTDLEPDQRKLLTTLDQSAKSLLGRINDVLELARLESGRVEPKAVSFSPADLMRAVEALYAPLVTDKGLVLKTVEGHQAARNVLGDPTLIKQILSQLVSNAVKNTEHGEIAIRTDISSTGHDDLWLSFTISDTGRGLDPDLIEEIQSQNSEDSDRLYEAGVGLLISRQLVLLMKGYISVETELNKGTRIRARIRVERDPDSIKLDDLVL